MDFHDWLIWAKANEDKKLISFNLENELDDYREANGISGDRYDIANLPAHIAEFYSFLSTTTEPPEKALGKFSKNTCSLGNRAGRPLFRSRPLAGIKAYGGLALDDELAMLSLTSATCKDGVHQIQEIIRRVKTETPKKRVLPNESKAEIEAIVKSKFVPSPRSTHGARARDATASPGSPTPIPAPRPSSEFMWVTSLNDLNSACAPPADPADAWLSSAHVTQIRKELGLFDRRDHEPDLLSSLNAALSRLTYRIFLKFSASFAPGPDLDQVRQPNVFSGGFEELFVSRRPATDPASSDDMPGRTVRLVDKRCAHNGLELEKCPRCGGEGLPEAVVPRSHLFNRGNPTLLSAHVAFYSDLVRYRAPAPDMIRRKNPRHSIGASHG